MDFGRRAAGQLDQAGLLVPLYFTDIVLSGVAMDRDTFIKSQVHETFNGTMYG